MIKDGYSICQNEWALDKTIKNELGLLLIISSLCAENGFCWANNKYFSDLFDEPEQTISRKIKKLADKGYIEICYEKRGTEITKRELRLTKMLTDHSQNCEPTINKNVKDKNINNKNISCPSDDERENQISLSSDGEIVQTSDGDITRELTNQEKFEKLWAIYPRKEGKHDAYRHYCSWLKGKDFCGKKLKLTPIDMWFAIHKYIDHIKNGNIERRFIQMGSTFFNSTIYDYLPTPEEIEAHTQ